MRILLANRSLLAVYLPMIDIETSAWPKTWRRKIFRMPNLTPRSQRAGMFGGLSRLDQTPDRSSSCSGKRPVLMGGRERSPFIEREAENFDVNPRSIVVSR